MNLFDLTGKVALITGGNGGIGLGIARGLAEAGARVVLAGRNRAKGEEAARALCDQLGGNPASSIAADVTSRAECDALIADAAARHGRLDILVNNAGTIARTPPEDLSDEDWQRVLDTNLTATFRLCRAAFPHLRDSGNGKIINIGSMMSIFGAPHAAPYAASKGGVVQFTRAIATAWAKDNIQANAVLPGWIATDMTAGAQGSDVFNEKVISRVPMRRWGEPEDFGGIAVYLASDASRFHTGDSFLIDGGYAIF